MSAANVRSRSRGWQPVLPASARPSAARYVLAGYRFVVSLASERRGPQNRTGCHPLNSTRASWLTSSRQFFSKAHKRRKRCEFRFEVRLGSVAARVELSEPGADARRTGARPSRLGGEPNSTRVTDSGDLAKQARRPHAKANSAQRPRPGVDKYLARGARLTAEGPSRRVVGRGKSPEPRQEETGG